MKRYLLFSGVEYYPAGGWSDFRGSYDSWEEAKTAYHLNNKERRDDWFEIVDTEIEKVIKHG